MDFLSKSDLVSMYNCVNNKQFERVIGEQGKQILEWRPGKQRFSPKQFRELQALIGLPLTRQEKYS